MTETEFRDFYDDVIMRDTLEKGQTANLKVLNEDIKIWHDRVDGSITIEYLLAGRWIIIARWR